MELQLLRLGDESHAAAGGRGHHHGEGASHHAEAGHEDWMQHGISRASSANLEQPGTPEQRDLEAAREPSPPARASAPPFPPSHRRIHYTSPH